ncbi:rhodanese-like domain-containing protein [Allohahella sp. A8]|uniref:rhodanese-like domain-containing protein n=1 Tax=Allohahella sp. A8 TaxID=3141461 RepID=UPI000C0BB76C|nr:sulfurtransferase [Hahellaceae bacterium]|tara:strand:- start:11991 stop:12461 length:471 start_codon:yes stop_codon:yes gene_type:complete
MSQFIEFVTNNWILCSVFVGLLIALLFTEKKRSGKTLSPQQTVMLLNRDQAVVLDVRDKKETSKGVITGSHVIPFTALKDRAAELKKFGEKTIVVVDKMGQHSGSAVKLLKTAGFTNVVRMGGGIVEWQSANLPLVQANGGKTGSGKAVAKSKNKS